MKKYRAEPELNDCTIGDKTILGRQNVTVPDGVNC